VVLGRTFGQAFANTLRRRRPRPGDTWHLDSDLMIDDDKTAPVSAAPMSLNMLIETEDRNDTWAEYTAWLEDVGFRQMRRILITSPGANGLLVGHKP
jgi:hypothetical protein